MPSRILLCGDVLGRLDALCKRLSSVMKANGPFDVLLCVGQFFPDNNSDLEQMKQYFMGNKVMPLMTYFIGDYGTGAESILLSAKTKSLSEGFKMDGIEVAKNLYWLKGSGKFLLNGLSVIYLGGRKRDDGHVLGSYSEDDVDALRACAEEPGVVDLFLTNEWPRGILTGVSLSDVFSGVKPELVGSLVVADLVDEIKPRYHVAAHEGIYFAREPYRNDGASHVTRFIGLASVGNDNKQKFIHALSPTPASMLSSGELSMVPSNSTPSPYKVQQQPASERNTRKHTEDSDSQYWRYDVSQKRRRTTDGDSGNSLPSGVCFEYFKKGRCTKGDNCRFSHDMDARKKTGHPGNISRQPCWFCLSSPDVDSHLIVSIGEDLYCALAKGPLVEDHLLIVPVEHLSSTLSISDHAEGELEKYMHAIRKYFKSCNKEAVVFERQLNLRASNHAHLQIIPVPIAKVSSIENQFIIAGKKLGFDFMVIDAEKNTDCRSYLKKLVKGDSGYFFVELPGGTILAHCLEEGGKMPMQFGREVIADVLGKPNQKDWRDCKLSKEEEAEMAEIFKKGFAAFDPAQS